MRRLCDTWLRIQGSGFRHHMHAPVARLQLSLLPTPPLITNTTHTPIHPPTCREKKPNQCQPQVRVRYHRNTSCSTPDTTNVAAAASCWRQRGATAALGPARVAAAAGEGDVASRAGVPAAGLPSEPATQPPAPAAAAALLLGRLCLRAVLLLLLLPDGGLDHCCWGLLSLLEAGGPAVLLLPALLLGTAAAGAAGGCAGGASRQPCTMGSYT